MIPTVFGENQSLWNGVPKHGIVDLVDCISCKAVQTQDDDSAEWELELKYPCSGQGAGELTYNKLIVAKANSWQQNQIFRIYSVIENIDQTLSVKAQHIFYDLGNVPVKPCKITSAGNFNSHMQNDRVISHNFTFTTDISDSTDWEIKEPISILSAVLDGDESWKGQYPGDIIFDNYSVALMKQGGVNRNVIINYGVDLVDLEQEKNISEMITGIYPYIKRSTTDSAYKENDPTTHYIYGSITYNKDTSLGIDSEPMRPRKIQPMDLSQYFKDKKSTPTVTQLNNMAKKVCKKIQVGLPKISLKLSYAYLGQDVRMFDKIRVKFPRLNIDTSAKVVKYQYDILLERVEEVELGYARSSNLFRLMDASKLRKGLLSLDRLADQSIDDKKIARGGVGKGSIGTKAVDTENIEDNSIYHDQLGHGDTDSERAIGSDNMKTDSVIERIIKGGAVSEAKIAQYAVTQFKIRSKQLVPGHLEQTFRDQWDRTWGYIEQHEQ